MYLKKVEIHGFKSFADRTEIEFEKGITGVVGPNGSGKSNVSDAIRWVLGEQSAKTLRGSKMEDVIFAGTTRRKPIGMAEVTLTLDNTQGRLPLDYSEVSVTRRVYRSGESEYYLNKSVCRLKDIKEIFMDTGVGIDGYSIIGQGRIDEILSNKSEDRRIIFDEAAGIVKYKMRKEEAEKKLSNTNQNLLRVNDIVNELQGRIEPLRSQSEKAKSYIQIKEELKFLELNLVVRELEQLKNNIETLKEQSTMINNQLKDYQNNRTNIEVEYKNYRKQVEELDLSINHLQSSIYEIVHIKDKKEGELILCVERIRNADENIIRLDVEIKNVEDNLSILEIQIKEGYAELLKINSVISDNQQILNSKLTELDCKNNDLQDQEESMERTKGNIIEILNDVATKKNELHHLEALKTSIEKRQGQIEEEIKQYKIKIEVLLQDKNNLYNSYNTVCSAFDEFKKTKNHLQLRVEESSILIANYSKELELDKQNIQEYSTRKKLLEEMQRDYEGFYQSVKNTLKLPKKDPIFGQGIIGVVAELMEVPKGLEVAIEVALGNAMQNIVCKTSEDAKRVIHYLKKNDYGRVTFLPLDNMKLSGFTPLNKKQLIDETGFIGIAVESIGFLKEYKDVFEYLLSRVIIVDKIETGIRLARKTGNKYKIVSIDGDVFNPGGSITGGSYKSKVSSILSRKRDIEEITDSINMHCVKYEEKKLVLEKENIYLKTLNKEYEINEQLLKEKEIALINLENSRIQVEKEVSDINHIISRFEKENAQLTADKEDTMTAIEIIKKEIDKTDEERNTFQYSVLDRKARFEELKLIKEALNNEVTALKIGFASQEQKKQHIELSIKGILLKQNELIALEMLRKKEVEELKNSKNQLLSQQHNISIEIKDVDVLKQQYEFNLSQVKSNKNVANENKNEMEQRLIKINDVITELQDSLHRIEVRLTRLEMQQDSSLSKLWEDYEATYMEAKTYKNDNINMNEALKNIKLLRNKLKEIGNVNANAIQEYLEVVERYEFLIAQKEDLIKAKNSLNKVIKEIDHIMRIQFLECFEKIKINFNEVFKKMFSGGKAEIVLDDEDEVLASGINIVAQPPGKKLQNLLLLSGGERALTAIALLFAILRVKPTPFCILDEIEASLDDANVHRFSDFLKEISDATQFIVVTHRKRTMEAVDALYGITMQEEGISTLVSVRLSEKAS